MVSLGMPTVVLLLGIFVMLVSALGLYAAASESPGLLRFVQYILMTGKFNFSFRSISVQCFFCSSSRSSSPAWLWPVKQMLTCNCMMRGDGLHRMIKTWSSRSKRRYIFKEIIDSKFILYVAWMLWVCIGPRPCSSVGLRG